MPNRQANSSRGNDLAARLRQGRRQTEGAPLDGARDIAVVSGLTPNCTAVLPLENVLVRAQESLTNSRRIYRYGNNVVMEQGTGEEGKLVMLATGTQVETVAAPQLANVFICEHSPKPDMVIQFPPPQKLVATLLRREPTLAALPLIKQYARRAVFDEHFCLRGPGWHEEAGILVHGSSVEPVSPEAADMALPARERLSPHLRELLQDFCFREDADVANAVAVLLTGMLVNRFITIGKPLVLLDGNQPGLGKTLLVRVIGVVLDGQDPDPIDYTADEEELRKRICATLRGSPQTQLLIDNAKTKAETAIHSAVIESNSMAPVVSLRILGTSENYTRPNDVLWYITMNNTRVSDDSISRCLPIRQFYEGNPAERQFGHRDPIQYARDHRQEILGELAGMVMHWNQMGRPDGVQNHRLTQWAQIVGGIMLVNGLPEFLNNLATAASEFNTGFDEIAALAEAVIAAAHGPAVFLDDDNEGNCDVAES
jgi:hypothetical protein